MRIIEINTHANKDHYYLYNQVFSLAKEHKVKGEFGNDYFTLYETPDMFGGLLKKWNIKFKEYIHKDTFQKEMKPNENK